MGDPLGVFFVFKAEVAAACRDDQGARQLGQHLIRRVAGRTVGVCHRFAVVREVEGREGQLPFPGQNTDQGILLVVRVDDIVQRRITQDLGIEPEIPGLPGFQGHTGRQRAACAVSANGYAALIAAPLGTVDKGIGRCVIALVKCHRPRSHRRGGVIQVHHDAPEPVGQIAAVKGVALHVGRHKTAAVDVDVDRAVLGPVFGAVDIEGILIVIHRPLDDLLSAEGAVVLIFLRVLGCLGPLGAHRGTLQDVHQLLMPFFRKCHCLCLLCYRCASRIARMIRCCACCHCPAIRTVKPWGLSRYS